MAWEIPGLVFTLEAAEDLRLKQHMFVKLDNNGKAVLCSAITDIPIGVLQNTPAVGQNAEIMLYGISKVVAGASCPTRSVIAPDATGRAGPVAAGTATTQYAVGQTVEGVTTAGNVLTATINCASPGRAA